MDIYNYIGFIGYFIVALAVFNKNDQVTKRLLIAACLFNATYFGFQELYISSGMNLVAALRIFLSLFYVTRKAAWLFIGIAIATPFVVPSTDYIAVIPAIMGTIAVYWLKGIPMRMVLLTGTCFWMLNNYIEGAWIGFFGEMFALTVGISRLVMMVLEKRSTQSESRQPLENTAS